MEQPSGFRSEHPTIPFEKGDLLLLEFSIVKAVKKASQTGVIDTHMIELLVNRRPEYLPDDAELPELEDVVEAFAAVHR